MDEREVFLITLCRQWEALCKKYRDLSEYEIIEQFMKTGHNTKLLCYLMEQVFTGTLNERYNPYNEVKMKELITGSNQKLNERIEDLKDYYSLFTLDSYQQDKKDIENSIYGFSKRIKTKFDLKNCDILKAMKGYIRFLNGAELHQFQKGKSLDAKPWFATTILVFESMDLAVRYVKDIPGNIIALVGIKPSDQVKKDFLESNFFAYLIKNGENVYALSDLYRGGSYYPSIAGRRDVYRDDLMPYVELGSFVYIWTEELFGIKFGDLNTDKYYIVPYGRQWDKWQLSELMEAEQVLLQFFMFNYLQNRFFTEKVPDLELSYTQSQVMLTIHNMPVNQKYLPIARNQNTVSIPLPLAEPKKMESLDLKHNSDLIPFAAGNGTLVDIYGKKIEDVEQNAMGYACDPRRLRGISSMMFGTEKQIHQYLNRLQSFNEERMIERIERQQEEIDKKSLIRFYEYLASQKFRRKLIEKALDIALNERSQKEREKNPAFWLTIEEPIGKYDCGFWCKDSLCELTGKKSTYMMRMRIKTIDQIMEIWGLNKEQLPKALTERNGLGLDFYGTISRGFTFDQTALVFNLSKTGLNRILKERGLSKGEVMKLIRGTAEYRKWISQ